MSSRSQNFIDFFYQLNYSLSILSDRARGFDTTWKNIFYKILSNEWEFICSASLLIYDKWRRVKMWDHKHKVFWQDQKIYFSFILKVKKEKWKMDYWKNGKMDSYVEYICIHLYAIGGVQAGIIVAMEQLCQLEHHP